MWVKLLKAQNRPEKLYLAGETYEVMDALGAWWVRNRLAVRAEMPESIYRDFASRLERGAGEMCLFLPYIGEFGHMVMSHLRLVQWHKAAVKIVCCRRGEEVLYPAADEFFTDWVNPIPDEKRVQLGDPRRWPEIEEKYPDVRAIFSGGFSRTEQRMVFHPGERIPFRPQLRGLKVDVCIGTRFRQIGQERNWFHWQRVADALTAEGLTFAVIGTRPTAPDLKGQKYHTGDFDTDAAIELMQNCSLYLGTDSGNTHLASAVGAEVLVIKGHRGDGFIPIMETANPGRVHFLPGGWEEPSMVIAAALEKVGVSA